MTAGYRLDDWPSIFISERQRMPPTILEFPAALPARCARKDLWHDVNAAASTADVVRWRRGRRRYKDKGRANERPIDIGDGCPAWLATYCHELGAQHNNVVFQGFGSGLHKL